MDRFPTKLNTPNWQKESWGKIAVELARRAAIFNIGDFSFANLEETQTKFIPHSTLTKRCGNTPTKTEWAWVYYPFLLKLLSKTQNDGAPAAALVAIGHFHTSGGSQTRRHWINYTAEDVNITNLATVVYLASLLNCNVESEKGLHFSKHVALTTDIVEQVNLDLKKKGKDIKPEENLLAPVALFVAENAGLKDDHFPLRLSSNALASAVDCEGITPLTPGLEEYPAFDPALNNGYSTWADAYNTKLKERANAFKFDKLPAKIAIGTVIARPDWGEERLKRGLIWLADICKPVNAKCVMAIPAWLPPGEGGASDSDALETGTLVIYARDTFPWSQLYDIISAYHSGGLMYLGKAEEERIESLTKYQQMMQQLQDPLRRISSAISEMQSDTQELRAVLYEPEEALFASYSLIELYFRGGKPIKFAEANLQPIPIKHSPDQYTEDREIRLVSAVLFCAVFGEDQKLFEERDENRILTVATTIMEKVQCRTSLKRMAADFRWLTEQNDLASLFREPEPDKSWPNKAVYSTALSAIKAALFTPFKTDSRQWPQAAFQLLYRHESFKKAELTILGATKKKDDKPCTNPLSGAGNSFPCSYATMLTFLRDIAGAARADKENLHVAKLGYNNDDGCCFSMTFSITPEIDVPDIRKKCASAFGLADWRLTGATYGDITRSFMVFANRLLGVNADWTDKSATLSCDSRVIQLERNGGLTFSVSWDKNENTLKVRST